MQSFQDTILFSDQSVFRLFQVVALAVHSLGRIVYTCSHPEPPPGYSHSGFPLGPPDLHHPNYQAFQLYPHGLANGVGYWIKMQIFGGVVLFEQATPQPESKVDTSQHEKPLTRNADSKRLHTLPS